MEKETMTPEEKKAHQDAELAAATQQVQDEVAEAGGLEQWLAANNYEKNPDALIDKLCLILPVDDARIPWRRIQKKVPSVTSRLYPTVPELVRANCLENAVAKCFNVKGRRSLLNFVAVGLRRGAVNCAARFIRFRTVRSIQDWVRFNKKHPMVSIDGSPDDGAGPNFEPADSSVRILERLEARQSLDLVKESLSDCLTTASEMDRQTFLAEVLWGREEIAELLRISEKTFEVRLSRARARLMDRLGKKLGRPPNVRKAGR